jgi:hypothetical protein
MDKRALGMAFRGSARRFTNPGASDISRSVGGISFGRDQSKECNKVAARMCTMVAASSLPGHPRHPIPNGSNSK